MNGAILKKKKKKINGKQVASVWSSRKVVAR
jgi:hypothetical protein